MSHIKPATNQPCSASNPQETELTLRELEVLSGIVKARRNSEIAQELFISPRTVEKHVENILRKLGVKGRKKAAQHFPVSAEGTEKSTETAAA